MKRYLIVYESDYCDDFPELFGECVIEAESKDEAKRKFYEDSDSKTFIISIHEEERNETK